MSAVSLERGKTCEPKGETNINGLFWASASSFLHSAVLHGDKQRVLQIIKENSREINALDRWGRSPIFLAVVSNNLEMLDLLMKADAKIDLADVQRKNVFHYVADKGLLGCLKLLEKGLERTPVVSAKEAEEGLVGFPGADCWGVYPIHLAAKLQSSKCFHIIIKYSYLGTIDCLDRDDRTPLHWAASHGSDENVLSLLKCGAKPSLKDKEGKLPLHRAAISKEDGSKHCLQLLLNNSISLINERDNRGLTALHVAVIGNHEEKVELILATKKCNINVADNNDQTPFHYACNSGSVAIAKCLLSHGADINKQDKYGATPLHFAAKQNRSALINLLLQQPGLKDLTTNEGETALHWATHAGANASIIRLKSFGGNLTRKDKRGKIPLHVIAKKTDGFTGTVEVLLQLHSPVNDKANDGCTPLHYAAREGNLKIVRQLLKADSSCLNTEDKLGRNALHHAVIGGNLHLTQILIETGIPTDSCDIYGRTCLHLAAFYNFSDVICLLIENKARANALDNERKTALHWACMEGHNTAASTLIECGCSVNAIGGIQERFTPLDYAVKFKRTEVIKTLEANGAFTLNALKEIATLCIQRNWRKSRTRAAFRRLSANAGDISNSNDTGFFSEASASRGPYEINGESGNYIRLPEGEELEAAMAAWKQRLSEVTLTKVQLPASRDRD